MPDNLLNRGPADSSRVNVHEKHEVRYWCSAFNCNEEQLRDVVGRVGPLVDDVRTALRAIRVRH